LRINLYKSETNDRVGKGAELWGWQLSLTWVKLHEIECWKAITSEIKKIKDQGLNWILAKSQIKTIFLGC
jgi:hypothetical protein